MNRKKRESLAELLQEVIDNKSISVLDNTIPSLRTTIEIAQELSPQKRDDMLERLDLIEKHYYIMSKYVKEAIDQNKSKEPKEYKESH